MSYSQRQVVMVATTMSDGTEKEHPHLILTPAAAVQKEPGVYCGVMMTSNQRKDKYTFETTPEMFESPLPKDHTQIRLHIFASFRDKDIRKLVTVMKKRDFKMVLDEIKDYVLVPD